MVEIKPYEQALNNFLEDREEFARAIYTSTTLVQHGGYFQVELFQDGTHRLRNELAHDTPVGLLLGIPHIQDEDLVELYKACPSTDEDDRVQELVNGESSWILDRAEEHIRTSFEQYGQDLDDGL